MTNQAEYPSDEQVMTWANEWSELPWLTGRRPQYGDFIARKAADWAREQANAEFMALQSELQRAKNELVEVIEANKDLNAQLCKEAIAVDAANARIAELESMVPNVKTMVDRFLGWKLPQDFSPDAGISFDPEYAKKWGMPSGTNLLCADQARVMFEYCLATSAQSEPQQADKVKL